MGRLTTLKPRIPSLHQPRGGWTDTRRGSAAERGYGAEWRRLRDETMREQGGLCQPCLRRGQVTTGCREVDHRTPKAQGGTDERPNLQCICPPCHKAKTARLARERAEVRRAQQQKPLTNTSGLVEA